MNAQNISYALNLLDDELLDEANAARSGAKGRAKLPGWLAWAACLILLVGVGALLHGESAAPPPAPVDLPKLPVSLSAGGMGLEGYLAYDISELDSGSPWRESDDFKTLPVYRNQVEYDGGGAPVGGIDREAMEARALEVADRLGMRMELQEDDPERVVAWGDGVKITVEADLSAAIFFEPALDLPEGYNFRYYAPYEDMKVAGDYLLKQYWGLLDMDEPRMEPTWGDYTFSGEQGYELMAYDDAGDAEQRLLQYSFAGASFACDDEGRLWIIRLQGTDLSEKVGNYPVITPQEAEKLLLKGKYITTVPYELPGEEYIQKVELAYRVGCRDEYFMPYYRFFVELPEEKRENGLNTYGAYYVPAVEEAYLTGFTIWDGSFNN